ncbi:MAG: hypothetical protein SCK70_05565, partial [bacterium]|nr:hypothetical protein [bacterium]
LKEKYPEKVSFYQYNTGGVGEIIEEFMEGNTKQKKMIRKVYRVPINLMAALQRGDLRGTNKYQKGVLGTEEAVWCEGGDLSIQNPSNYYTQEQIDDFINDLVAGRREYTEEIASEGLEKQIIKFAEDSFHIEKRSQKSTVYMSEKADAESQTEKMVTPSESWVSKARPPRPTSWR